MSKKMSIAALVLYVVYAVGMYFYIFHGPSGGVPATLKGTVADPETFMTERELYLSDDYSKIRNFLFFVITPFEWLVYLLILLTGISRIFEKWAETKWKLFKNGAYLFLLYLFTALIFYPIDIYRYQLSKEYGISTQDFSSWMRDYVIDFWVNFGTTLLLVLVLYWLIQKSAKKWWLYAWLLTIPFAIFMMYLQPVVIDPLYNEFTPLKDKQLEEKILKLANQADIPSEHVFEVNMSEKTNALNAYVTGIGDNSRIVLWDTTLNELTDEEILFIMAHEMGHYVEKHIYVGIASYLLSILVGLWLISKIMPWMVARFGKFLNIEKVGDIRSLPLFFVLVSFLLFISNPLSNYISRYQETRADEYAMELTGDAEAAVSTFQNLAKAGLSEVNPPWLVKIFRYTHPPMLERINTIARYTDNEEVETEKGNETE
ncbi:M48 family metallopeptidase [Ureibacillus sinduriensis]|uniref:Peptidase M48 n=1 Tax=Ureibacillus sinduriensis BLB-1 = JCM 15800 TaxID=1384057 RepID=A0A0A3HQA4_9BACL|nr:M48 family metallopeptidase [Ureibacillus sinduriensis]KGR74584.1 peptidase M48 [Ureibacillus sinduriensis BLB-1 = JCM 15800]